MKNTKILFFYSHYNPVSLNSKIVLSKALDKVSSSLKMSFKFIDVLTDPELCKKYCVSGVPTTLILSNESIVTRLLGEFEENEILLLIEQLRKNKTEEKK